MKTKFMPLLMVTFFMVGCSDGADNNNADNKSDVKSESMTQDTAKVGNHQEQQFQIDDIVGTKWQLVILEGQQIDKPDDLEQAIYFELQEQDNRVVGFAGCNTFNGTYKIEKGMRIRFSQMLSTLKTCPYADVDEHAFLAVFELTDNYTISRGQLSLNVGRRAPLAVFEQP